MKINHWTNPPGRLEIKKGDVQVWTARLDHQDASDFSHWLNAEELKRAARMRSTTLADYFVIGRGILRCLLGAYLDVLPGDVEFEYGPQGKPMLSSALDTSIAFNVSHSNGLAVYAFARGQQAGMDIEMDNPLEDLDAMAKMTFSPQECAELKARTGAEKQELFYRIWTCREAVIKMIGSGWTQPLRSLTFNLAALASGSAELNLPDGSLCWLQVFRPAQGFTAALAVRDGLIYIDASAPESIQKDVL